MNSKGIQSDDSAEQKEAEKAPHPLLFKYNEVGAIMSFWFECDSML